MKIPFTPISRASFVVYTLTFCLIPSSTQQIHLSSEDLETVAQIRLLISEMKADCKDSKLAEFHIDELSPYLQEGARGLAKSCMADR